MPIAWEKQPHHAPPILFSFAIVSANAAEAASEASRGNVWVEAARIKTQKYAEEKERDEAKKQALLNNLKSLTFNGAVQSIERDVEEIYQI